VGEPSAMELFYFGIYKKISHCEALRQTQWLTKADKGG
jgi:hypothetical protein